MQIYGAALYTWRIDSWRWMMAVFERPNGMTTTRRPLLPPNVHSPFHVNTFICGCGDGSRMLDGFYILNSAREPMEHLSIYHQHSQFHCCRDNLHVPRDSGSRYMVHSYRVGCGSLLWIIIYSTENPIIADPSSSGSINIVPISCFFFCPFLWLAMIKWDFHF